MGWPWGWQVGRTKFANAPPQGPVLTRDGSMLKLTET